MANMTEATTPAILEKPAVEKPVMLVGVDDSEHSYYTLQWTLQHFFSSNPGNSPFKLIIVHAKPQAVTSVSFAGPAAVVVPYVDNDSANTATSVIDKAKAVCVASSVEDVIGEVVDGDPRNVLVEAVENHHASILVVGSHGYGSIRRAVLGSVSDYCAHHAHCTVMIVKQPKH